MSTTTEMGGGLSVGFEKCPCGRCNDWHLTGIGKFVQGSGFTKGEAEIIVAALSSRPSSSSTGGQGDGAVQPAQKPGGIDFSDWTYNTLPERTGNVGWQPDLQDLIYTAISHVEGDYEDADDNAAEQVIERLVLAIKALLGREKPLPPEEDIGSGGREGEPSLAAAIECLQAIIDWADYALSNRAEFDSHGTRNLDGPVFDTARAFIAKATGSDQ